MNSILCYAVLALVQTRETPSVFGLRLGDDFAAVNAAIPTLTTKPKKGVQVLSSVKGLVVTTLDGKVGALSATESNPGNFPVDVGISRESVITAMGNPDLDTPPSFLYAKQGMRVTFNPEGFVKRIELSLYEKLAAELRMQIQEREEAKKRLPGYGLVLRESSGFTSSVKKTGKIVSATVIGVVKNFRTTTVSIKVKCTWRSRSGAYAGGSETLLYQVDSGEEVSFRSTSYDVFKPYTYSVSLFGV